tara:strand:- start:153 stop:809 length:657 start_codon:yes stop_codon:yes gene_type:complete
MFFNKKGVGHIEIIMAFVLFIGFIGFAFYFLNPFQSDRTLHSSLDYAFDEIVENVSITLESYSVVFPTGCSDTTVEIDSEISGNYLGGTRDGNKFCGFGSENFITILISEEFPQNTGSCQPPSAFCSIISSSENKQIISKKKILDLNESYYSDYSLLKKDFNLPGRIDFGFSLIFDDGSFVVAEKEIPSNLEVVAKKDRIEVVTEEGILFADLIVKIW